MKTYLVAGGLGFAGTNFILHLVKKYPEAKIINLDSAVNRAAMENLDMLEDNLNYLFVEGNINDRDLVMDIFLVNDIDYVINFAEESDENLLFENPNAFAQSNILGAVTLLSCAKEIWEEADKKYKEGARFVQVSTDKVYGNLEPGEYFGNGTKLVPTTQYAASKASADLMAESYFKSFNFPVSILRFGNLFGPYQHPSKLIPKIITHCFSKEPIDIINNGLNVRDWIYIEDALELLDFVIEKGESGKIYNAGSYHEKEDKEIVQAVVEYIKNNIKEDADMSFVNYKPDKDFRDTRRIMASELADNEFKWHPVNSMSMGIEKTVNWYEANQKWLQKILHKKDYRFNFDDII